MLYFIESIIFLPTSCCVSRPKPLGNERADPLGREFEFFPPPRHSFPCTSMTACSSKAIIALECRNCHSSSFLFHVRVKPHLSDGG